MLFELYGRPQQVTDRPPAVLTVKRCRGRYQPFGPCSSLLFLSRKDLMTCLVGPSTRSPKGHANGCGHISVGNKSLTRQRAVGHGIAWLLFIQSPAHAVFIARVAPCLRLEGVRAEESGINRNLSCLVRCHVTSRILSYIDRIFRPEARAACTSAPNMPPAYGCMSVQPPRLSDMIITIMVITMKVSLIIMVMKNVGRPAPTELLFVPLRVSLLITDSCQTKEPVIGTNIAHIPRLESVSCSLWLYE